MRIKKDNAGRISYSQMKELRKNGLKYCCKCKEILPLNNDFWWKCNKKPANVQSYCIKCLKTERESKEHKKRRQLKEKGFKICPLCKKELLISVEIWGRCKRRKSGIYWCCKKCRSKYEKECYKKNTEKARERTERWRLKRPSYARDRHRERRNTDKKFKIQCNLRNRIWYALKGKNKSLNTMFLIGCDIDYLMYHIQCQFKKGMNWDNYGPGHNGKKQWHVDHIIPCSVFDLTNQEEQRKCFNYTNLQPLWAKENLQKHSKIIERKL